MTAGDEKLLKMWRSVQGPSAGLTGPLIRFAGLVADTYQLEIDMATNREKILARKLLAMTHEHKAQATDPDKWNREFEELALKLARLCVGTRP